MAEQLTLADAPAAPPRAPSAWTWAREHYAGRKIARVIDLRHKQQAFVVINEESGYLVDGSTHFLHTPAAGLTPDEETAALAEYDAAWHDWKPAA